MFKHILIATDGSEVATKAVSAGLNLANVPPAGSHVDVGGVPRPVRKPNSGAFGACSIHLRLLTRRSRHPFQDNAGTISGTGISSTGPVCPRRSTSI